jgi:hypothetical protein
LISLWLLCVPVMYKESDAVACTGRHGPRSIALASLGEILVYYQVI